MTKLFAGLLALALAALPAAAASRRVAIVAGVADYGGRADLTSPVRDAQEIGVVLGKLGFEVRVLANPRSGDVEKTFAALAAEPGGDIDQLAFFFSGHGMTLADQSVLVLNDGGPRRLVPGLLPLSTLIKGAASLHAKATLFLLDACRTNGDLRLPGARLGLAPPPRATGAFFAYAAAPGDVALDDARRNALSPFTLALADEFLVPNQDIAVLMRKVRERVARATRGRELPWTEDSLTGPMILNQAPTAPALFALYGRSLKGEPDALRDLGLAYLNGQGTERDIERGLALLGQAATAKDVPAMLSLGDYEAARDANALFPDSKARGWYRKAADAGSGEGWYRLAELDRKALPADTKPSEATLEAYRRAAAGGNADARARYLALNLAFGFDTTLDRAKTIAALRPLAADHDLLAIATLGEAYSEPGAAQDFKEGDFWLAQAVAAGSTEALLAQAKNYALGRGRPVDAPKAYALTLEAARRGDPLAMLFVGRKLQQGVGVAPDKTAAVAWFRKASETGSTEAFADLGFAYERGLGVDRDLTQAVAFYRRGADLKSPVATRYLAVMHENGDGVPRNMDKAIALYERAAALGDVRAKGSLAVLAVNGLLESVPDFKRGAQMLREAVAGGDDADYIFKLAQMTEQGRGMPADVAAAAKLYRRAADLGSGAAMTELATLTLEGEGVAKDPAAAKALYEKAAKAGDAVAYTNLSQLARRHWDATHDPADLDEAGRWIRRGAEAGERTAMSLYGGDLLLGEEGFAKDPAAGLDWMGRSLATGYPTVADKLQAIVTDKALDVPQSVRDGALVVLAKAATRQGNALAARALQVIWRAREGTSLAGAPRAALERHFDGPDRATIALLLGQGYADGRFGGKPDGAAARTFLQIAADAGEAQAWQALGDLQRDRLVPDATPEKAVGFYAKGAAAGDPGALVSLAIAYQNGYGTTLDGVRGFQALERAASQGYAPAMYYLGKAYQEGDGTSTSPFAAARWFEQAVDAGLEPARNRLVAVLLNRAPDDRDYSRAFLNIFYLAAAKQPSSVKMLEELLDGRELPKWARERAAFLLGVVARKEMPQLAEPALARLVARRALERQGGRFVAVD